MAVPIFCRKKQLSNWKIFSFITIPSRVKINLTGYSPGSSCCWSSSYSRTVLIPWLGSMFVYIAVASVVKRQAVRGSCPSPLRSDTIWRESLVLLGQRWRTCWN